MANQTETSTYKGILFEIFLRAYHKDDNNYIQDLKYLKIFKCKAQVHILQKKRAKSCKYIGKIKEGILIDYKNINIF